MTTSGRSSRREHEHTALASGSEAGRPPLASGGAGTPHPAMALDHAVEPHRPRGASSAASHDRPEPFRLFLRKGSDRYRVTFCVSGVRYEGSTQCEEYDLAVMVARAVHAEIRGTAGRLATADPRRSARTVRSVRGCWMTSRPKRMPWLCVNGN